MKKINLVELDKLQEKVGGKLYLFGKYKGDEYGREITCSAGDEGILNGTLESLSIESVYSNEQAESSIGTLLDVYPIQFGVSTNFIIGENGASVDRVKKQLEEISNVVEAAEDINKEGYCLFNNFEDYEAQVIMRGTDWHNNPWGVEKRWVNIAPCLDVESTTLNLKDCVLHTDGMKALEVSRHEVRITGVDDTTGYNIVCYHDYPDRIVVDGSIKVLGYETIRTGCNELVIEEGVEEVRPYAVFSPYSNEPVVGVGSKTKLAPDWKKFMSK